MSKNTDQPALVDGVSILICCYNSAKKITPTLQHLARLLPTKTQWPVEVVLINNNSSDDTVAVANQVWDELNTNLKLTCVEEPRPGHGNALECGYNAARYELMVMCDDDNWLNENYLQLVEARFLSNPDIGLLGGWGHAWLNDEPIPKWFEKYKVHYVCAKPVEQSGYYGHGQFSIWGAGSVLRKSAWRRLTAAGFSFINARTSGKALGADTELAIALNTSGFKLYFDDALQFTHDLSGGRVTWDNLIEQAALNGRCSAVTWLMLRVHANIHLSQQQCRQLIANEIGKFKYSQYYIELVLFVTKPFYPFDPIADIRRREKRNELLKRKTYYCDLIPGIYQWMKAIGQTKI
ncbi:MAG: glycosyltransferase [Bacteroidetes bacterium]|nr:MAG: glycosyltransferase [Bacteroidota bacterium]